MRLLLLTFVSGAAVMALEIVGSRVLAPHFGGSLFVWGSLIGVFLLAMAVGHAAGGGLSRRAPFLAWPCALLALAGAFVVLLPAWADGACSALSPGPEGGAVLGPRSGPLAACLLLFGAPTALAVMVVPFAVRLAARDLQAVGQVAGRLYAVGTAGSIAGTLATAFWLIPAFGTRGLVTGIGVAQIGAALAAFPGGERRAGALGLLAVAVAATGLRAVVDDAPAVFRTRHAEYEILAETETAYERVFLTRTTTDEVDGATLDVRCLWFGREIQGCVYDHPSIPRGREGWTALGYTDLLHLHRLFVPEPGSILLLGGGAGIAPRALLRHMPGVVVDVVERDADVTALAESHFGAGPAPGITHHVDDGRLFLRRHPGRRWDVIIVDVFTGSGTPPFHMATREFMAEVRGRLAPGGVALFMVESPLAGPDGRLFRSMAATADAAFDTVWAFPGFDWAEPHRREDWDREHWTAPRDVLLVCGGPDLPDRRAVTDARARDLWRGARAPGRDYWTSELFLVPEHAANAIAPEDRAALAATLGEDPWDADDALVLTDDHAPVELMSAKRPAGAWR